ncbi:MAG: diguanylate cyclase [Oscillospiraceae bacterium]|nr:diguanylate cyclase [Oscillospiraceae bacterium]
MDESKKNSVLIVDDESSNIMALTHILSPVYTVFAAKNGYKALEAAEKYLPDVILLDILMPEMDGYAVLGALKNTDRIRDIPVIIITGLGNADDEEKGLSLGASDYISKPFNPAIVKLRVGNQIKMFNQLRIIEQVSMIDQLTSIPNRRGFDNRMDMEWVRAIRESTLMSILILDVDKFKVYNDTYGHQQGDAVLQAVAAAIARSLGRPGDFAARWGGEEFVVLLPNTDLSGALHIAEKIRVSVGNLIIPCPNGKNTGVTVSMGVKTQAPRQNSSRDSFIFEADKALYKAKETGRNRVCHAD